MTTPFFLQFGIRLLVTMHLVLIPTTTAWGQIVTWSQVEGLPEGGGGPIKGYQDGTLLLATRNGIFQSTDNGGYWRTGITDIPILSHETVLGGFARTSQGNLFVSEMTEGILKSTDGGNNWHTVLDLATQFPSGKASQIHVGTDDTLFALITAYGVIRSADEGQQWELTPLEQTRPFIYASSFLASDNGEYYLLEDKRDTITLFVSRDNCRSWSSFSRYVPGYHILAGFDCDNAGNVYIGSYDKAIYQFSQFGAGFQILDTPSQGGQLVSLRVDVGNNTLYCSTRDRKIYKSLDRGAHWSEIPTQPSPDAEASLGISGDGTLFANCLDGYLYRSSNHGASWTRSDSGLCRGSVFTITPGHELSLLTVKEGYDGFYMSSDEGQSWIRHSLPLPTLIERIVLDNDGNYVVRSSDDVLRFNSSQQTWDTLHSYYYPGSVVERAFLAVLPDGSIVTSFPYLPFRFDATGSSGRSFGISSINCLLARDTTEMFAGNEYGLYVTSDNGRKWERHWAPETQTGIWSLAEAPDRTLYAGGTSGRVFRSVNRGQTWETTVTGLSYWNIVAMTVTDEGVVFAGSAYDGIAYSSDKGISWRIANEGLAHKRITQLRVTRGGHILASTQSGGIYRTVDRPNSVEHSPIVDPNPLEPVITEVYPSPSSNSVRVAGRSRSEHPAKIEVIDLLGRTRLHRVILPDSNGAIVSTFHVFELPSATYLLRITDANGATDRLISIIR